MYSLLLRAHLLVNCVSTTLVATLPPVILALLALPPPPLANGFFSPSASSQLPLQLEILLGGVPIPAYARGAAVSSLAFVTPPYAAVCPAAAALAVLERSVPGAESIALSFA